MKTEDYPLIGSYNNQRISSIDAERSVNCYEYLDSLGKKPKILIQTSGIENTGLDFQTNTSPFRTLFLFNGILYAVVGNTFYTVTQTLTVLSLTSHGTLSTSLGYVGISANTFQVIMVDGTNGYIWDTVTSTFTTITDTSFPMNPVDVCYLDGFFIVAAGTTNNFLLSSFNQGFVWGPAANSYSASVSTNLLTIGTSTLSGGSPGTLNFQTGAAFTFNVPTGDTFTGADATELLTLTSGSIANYITGDAVKVSGGSLPTPLVAGTIYYVISNSPTTIYLATTYANALAATHIDLTSDGSGTIISQPPDPLNTSTTYYSIFVSGTTIKVASSLSNAQLGIAITLTSNAGANSVITSNGQLQQGSITSDTGTIVACKTLHRRLFLFSQFFTEVWENQGVGSNLPFRRTNSALIEYGTPAIASVVVGFDKMFFLSQDRDGLGSVMQVEGVSAVPISTKALDFQLAQYIALNTNPAGQGVADAKGILIKENGIIFYRLNFTTANHTFVYNVTFSDPSSDETKRWHEEEVLNGDRHPAQVHAFFNGINYYGSYNAAILYIVDVDLTNNDGEAIRRMRIGKPVCPGGYQRTRIDRFQIDLLQGQVGQDLEFESETLQTESGSDLLTEDSNPLVTDQVFVVNEDTDPEIFFSYSKDGGQSYGTVMTLSMGEVGQRTYRTVIRKLGVVPRGQSFVPKIEYYSDAPFFCLGAAWAYEVLPE